MPEITLTIDGGPVTVPAGTTILKAAEQARPACSDHLLSRSLHGQRSLPHLRGRSRWGEAAVAGVREPGERRHESPHLERARRAQPPHDPGDARLRRRPFAGARDSTTSCDEYCADRERFPDAERREVPVLDDNPMYIRDYSQMHPVLALRSGVRRRRAVYLRDQLQRARVRHQHRHLLRQADAGNHLRILRPVRGRLPHRRAQAQARVAARAGLQLDEIMQSTRGGKKRRRKSP